MRKWSLLIILGLFGLLYGGIFSGCGNGVSSCYFTSSNAPRIYITTPTSSIVTGDSITLTWTYYNTTIPTGLCQVYNFSLYDPNGDLVIFEENSDINDLSTTFTYEITNATNLNFQFVIIYPVLNDTTTYIRSVTFQWVEGGSASNIWVWLIIIGLGIGIAVGIYVYYKNKQPKYPTSSYRAYPPSYPMPFPPLQSPQSKVLSSQCQSQDKLLNDPFCIDEFVKLYGKTPQEQFRIKKQLRKI